MNARWKRWHVDAETCKGLISCDSQMESHSKAEAERAGAERAASIPGQGQELDAR